MFSLKYVNMHLLLWFFFLIFFSPSVVMMLHDKVFIKVLNYRLETYTSVLESIPPLPAPVRPPLPWLLTDQISHQPQRLMVYSLFLTLCTSVFSFQDLVFLRTLLIKKRQWMKKCLNSKSKGAKNTKNKQAKNKELAF